MTPAQARKANERVRLWNEPRGILRFVSEQFQATPDGWQEEALLAFEDPRPDKRFISLQAAAGVGKSAVEAWCALYFMGAKAGKAPGGYDHPNGVVTGITGANLRDNFWKEIAKWQSRSPYMSAAFTWSPTRFFANDHPQTWFLAPRNWPKTGNVDEQGATLSGLHGRYVAVFIDESGAIPPSVLRAAKQAMFEGPIFGKILQAGNPISLEGMLYLAATRERGVWTIIRVTNDPEDPRCSPRADKALMREEIARWGRDNPWIKSYVLGEFPPSSLNALLGVEEVEAAMERELQPHQFSHIQKRLGVDVARFGDDLTCLFARQGLNARVGGNNPVIMRNARTTEIAARIMVTRDRWAPESIFIDEGAMGAGVIDTLHTAGVAVIPIPFGGSAIDKRYHNRRTEMWWNMAQAVKAGAALPNIPELVQELTAPTYTFHAGAIWLEEKAQIKKRLGSSPDRADALALTYALPDMPSGLVLPGQESAIRASAIAGTAGSGRALTDFDPLAWAA